MGRPIDPIMFLRQLTVLNSFWRRDYGIDTVIIMSEDTVRLCMRRRHKINVDVTLSSLDLYDFKAYLLRNHGLEIAVIYNERGFNCEQIDEVLKTILRTAEKVWETANYQTLEEIYGHL